MAKTTLKVVARVAGVAPVTVSRVVNGSENVATTTKERVLAIIRDLDYVPNVHATHLRRKKSIEGRSAVSRGPCADDHEGLEGHADVKRSLQEPFRISFEERRDLARRIIRLRKDLDRLRKDAERIQTCVEIIQEAYSRR